MLFVGSFGSGGKTTIAINGVSHDIEIQNVSAFTISKNDSIRLVTSQGALILLIPNSNAI